MTMRFARCAFTALVIAAAHGTVAQAAESRGRQVLAVDRIIAVVNDEVITRVDLADSVRIAIDSLKRQGTTAPDRAQLERQVLERMINQRVQAQYGRETGVRIDDTQLERAIARIAEDNKLTLPALRAALEKDGVSFTRFREDIRLEMLVSRLREREVDSKIMVTEGEVDAFLQNRDSVVSQNDEYNLAHILVRVPEQASPEQIRARLARAEEAVAMIRKGSEFGQVSATFSDAPEALQGGMLGWREAARLPALFLDAVKSMRIGDVSPILRSANGFHVLRLVDVRGTAKVIVEQVRARHILIKTSEILSESEARARVLGLRERIENGADFAELARLHSQDGSASKGGDLGWISPGDTVPDFERTMLQLKIGELSPPVKTEFGWHLIQVQERRTEDMSKERQRLTARQALRNRKSDEAYEDFVRQLRDKAYVELRLEER
jgi:peptidyl-prolyl cis-trans isomerase SurA